MLENTGILVAGLSGGADSVCLVAVLKRNYRKRTTGYPSSGGACQSRNSRNRGRTG